MQESVISESVPSVEVPVMLVAEVQDSLFMVIHDLNRLDGLLAHTMENLMLRFSNALSHLESAGRAGLTWMLPGAR